MSIENRNTENDTKARPVRVYSSNHLNMIIRPPTNDDIATNARIAGAVNINLFSFLN
jgi:hypothetical protein